MYNVLVPPPYFFQMIILSMHLSHRINVMHGLFGLRVARGKWNIQNEKFLTTVGLEPTTFRVVIRASTDWAWWKLSFQSDLYTKVLYIEVLLWRVPDQVECLVVFWKQIQGFCVFFLFVQFRYSPICKTMQYMYKTKHALLNHASNLYQCKGSTCIMYKGHFKRRAFINPG